MKKKTGTSPPVNNPMTTNCISEEVITAEILPRLPVKSLLKFRCVSKSWCYMISSDKDFIKSHLENSKKKKSLIASLRLPKTGIIYRSRLMQSPLESLFKEPTSLAVEGFVYHDFNKLKPYEFDDDIDLLGSCNGLSLLSKSDMKVYYLWNPATNKSHKLPKLHNSNRFQWAAGFCFDEATNDYKVLVFCQIYVKGEPAVAVKIYSLSTNCWRQVENKFPLKKNFSTVGFGKLLNGKLHWSVHESSHHIVSFDLESEEFGFITQPTFEDDESFCYRTVGVLDGCLSCNLMKSRGIREYMQVWVMKEYGNKESWHLVANIFQDHIDGIHINRPGFEWIPGLQRPIHKSQGGEILFSDDSGFFVIYNPETEYCRYLNLSGGRMCAYTYVESLVSPVPVSKEQKKKRKREVPPVPVGESEMPQSQG